jgi:hypothetical protein
MCFKDYAAQRRDFIHCELCTTLTLIQRALVITFFLIGESRLGARLRIFYRPLTPSLRAPPYTDIVND